MMSYNISWLFKTIKLPNSFHQKNQRKKDGNGREPCIFEINSCVTFSKRHNLKHVTNGQK